MRQSAGITQGPLEIGVIQHGFRCDQNHITLLWMFRHSLKEQGQGTSGMGIGLKRRQVVCQAISRTEVYGNDLGP